MNQRSNFKGTALLDEHPGLPARDALHAAVVRHHDLDGLCSYDRGFDSIPGLERTQPSCLFSHIL